MMFASVVLCKAIKIMHGVKYRDLRYNFVTDPHKLHKTQTGNCLIKSNDML